MLVPSRSFHALRNAFEKGCDGKRVYRSRGHALIVQDKLKHVAAKSHRIDTCTAYKCLFCGSWHLGHDKFSGKP